MPGRAAVFALGAGGRGDSFANEIRVAMTLIGVTSVTQIDRTFLACFSRATWPLPRGLYVCLNRAYVTLVSDD